MITHIDRTIYLDKISQIFRINPICALLGPRQCGKTTIAKLFKAQYQGQSRIFDLEDPDHCYAFREPKLVLDHLEGLIIIDEVQRSPELFPYLRSLVDRKPNLKILILGSASTKLLKQSSESLAGRISYIEMTPFSLGDIDNLNQLWLRGGFPKSYLANSDSDSLLWRKSYIRNFLEQDIPNLLGIKLNPQNMRRFWMMMCDYHGNIFNSSELGRALGLDHKTVKYYLDILAGTFMIRQLQPWFVNISKRQVKSYKTYFRDSGIFHGLLSLENNEALFNSSKIGASWEGFAMEEIIRHYNAEVEDCFFWATQSDAEIDLLITKNNQLYGFEFKFSSSPKITKAMRNAMNYLQLQELQIIIPGNIEYYLEHNIKVIGLQRLIT